MQGAKRASQQKEAHVGGYRNLSGTMDGAFSSRHREDDGGGVRAATLAWGLGREHSSTLHGDKSRVTEKLTFRCREGRGHRGDQGANPN